MSGREFAFAQHIAGLGVGISEADRDIAQADYNAGWHALASEIRACLDPDRIPAELRQLLEEAQ